MYFKVLNLAKRLGEIFFEGTAINYYQIESDSYGNMTIILENSNLHVGFWFTGKNSYPDTCNDILVKYNFNTTINCKINEYSHDLYFNASIVEDIGIEHSKIQAAVDEIEVLETPHFYHDLIIRVNC